MLTVISFLKKHWKPIAVVIALVAAFGAGRFATPTKVHVVTVVDTKVVTTQAKEVVKYRDRVTYVDRVVERVTHPDGSVTEKITDKSKRESASGEANKSSSTASVDTSVKTDKVTISDAPRFTVSLLGGYQFHANYNMIPNAGSWALGLQLQYRVAGPLQVGVFGLTTGTVGLSLGLTF